MDVLGILKSFSGTFFTILFFAFLYYSVRFLMNRQAKGNTDASMIRSIILFSILLIAIISVILALPMSPDLRAQISSLIGIVISAVLALSSATFIGNALAGIMIKAIKSFKPGDFIEVNGLFGRITEMGLFHTEIQVENRDLTTIPNLNLATNPVRVTRSSGTFVSSEVSLGYDVNRVVVEKALLSAAKKCGLDDAFVLITSLGDFSIVYRLQGLLKEVKSIIITKSRLNAMVLDELHAANIEIVSPNFMNQRQIGETIFIPAKEKEDEQSVKQSQKVENIIFDKAEEADGIEQRKKYLNDLDAKLKALNEKLDFATTEEEKQAIIIKIEKDTAVREKLVERIGTKLEELSDKE